MPPVSTGRGIRRPGETDEQFADRKRAAYDENFVGATVISQAMLFNANPIGQALADERLETLKGPGGIQVCGNSQNCVAVCPRSRDHLDWTSGRAATVHSIKELFEAEPSQGRAAWGRGHSRQAQPDLFSGTFTRPEHEAAEDAGLASFVPALPQPPDLLWSGRTAG